MLTSDFRDTCGVITPITSQGFDPLFTNERWPVMEANAAKLAPMGKPKMVLLKIHAATNTNHRYFTLQNRVIMASNNFEI